MKLYNTIRIFVAIRVRSIRPYLLSEDEQKKLHILELKNNLRCLGLDLSVSDNDINLAADKMGKALQNTCVSASQLSAALKTLVL